MQARVLQRGQVIRRVIDSRGDGIAVAGQLQAGVGGAGGALQGGVRAVRGLALVARGVEIEGTVGGAVRRGGVGPEAGVVEVRVVRVRVLRGEGRGRGRGGFGAAGAGGRLKGFEAFFHALLGGV